MNQKKRMRNAILRLTISHSPLSSAVRTRLELATPCVTGRYSNQLNYRTILSSKGDSQPPLRCRFLCFAMQSYGTFLNPPNIFSKKFQLFSISPENQLNKFHFYTISIIGASGVRGKMHASAEDCSAAEPSKLYARIIRIGNVRNFHCHLIFAYWEKFVTLHIIFNTRQRWKKNLKWWPRP